MIFFSSLKPGTPGSGSLLNVNESVTGQTLTGNLVSNGIGTITDFVVTSMIILVRWNTYNFIKDIRYVGGKHLFLFSTSHSGGNNFNALYTCFKEHGLTFIGGRAYKGAEYGPMGEPCPTAADGHPDDIDLKDAVDPPVLAENARGLS